MTRSRRSTGARVLAVFAVFVTGAALALVAGGCGSGSSGSTSASVTGLGNACIPESENDPNGGGAVLTDLGVDTQSTSCDTRVCLQAYFQGRVTCPYGNATSGQTGTCSAVAGMPGLYTLDGTASGDLCCPAPGDAQHRPLTHPVEAQCSGRSALDSVYCSCRCDVPAGVDRSTVSLCACPTGFSCLALFDNASLPLAMRGSYCVKAGPLGADLVQNTLTGDETALVTACGLDRKP